LQQHSEKIGGNQQIRDTRLACRATDEFAKYFAGATTPNFKAHWIIWESLLCSPRMGRIINQYNKLKEIVNLKSVYLEKINVN